MKGKSMKKRFLLWTLLAALTLPWLAGTAYAASNPGGGSSAVVEARNGVVRVIMTYDLDLLDPVTMQQVGSRSGYSSGSAFGVGTAGEETDVFISNRHVFTVEEGLKTLNDKTYYTVPKITGYYILLNSYAFNSDTFTIDTGRAIPFSVAYLGEGEDADVAVLKASEKVPGRVALPLLDNEDSLEVLDPVSSLGYPGSSDDATSEGYLLADVDDVTSNSGQVSRFYDSLSVTAEGSALKGHLIHHNVVINSGNSGGPLVDQNGVVVGINTYTYHGGSDRVTNSYYALRVKYAKDALDSLGIDYDVYRYGPNIPWAIIITVAAVIAVAIVIAVVAVMLKKPGKDPPPAQEYRIQGQSGSFAGRRFSINGQVRIGRDPGCNDLVYPGGTPGISGQHCLVSLSGDQLTLTDLGSSYGTFLAGGKRLTPNQPVTLHIGERFYLGSETQSFVITGKGGSLT